MCILIDNQNGATLTDATIQRCVTLNPDGFGFYDCASRKLTKTINMETAAKMLSSNRPFVAHCRYATVGDVSLENVHPAVCADGSLLFQNGTIEGINVNTGENDTKAIARLLDHVKKHSRLAFLSSFDSRFVLIEPNGTIHRTGEWHESSGVLYSKKNVLEPAKRRVGYYSDFDFGTPHGGFYDEDQADSVDHIVAVYGTLKHGFGNHRLLQNSRFIGYGTTAEPYRLCVDGLPYLIRDEHDSGMPVYVEVYAVDDETMEDLDRLEGHPTFYRREQVDIDMPRGYGLSAWTYFVGEEHDNGKYHDEYVG